jgi:two-component system LytT family response regulator
MTIRVGIVDDEPLARERLLTLLADEPDVEIVGECATGVEALTLVTRSAPDLLFLDVQMPEMDGFDVIAALEPDQVPAVIFVTAYDHYAIRAFDVHALDYLLKPFDRDRFTKALGRARTQLVGRPRQEVRRELARLLQSVRREPARRDRLLLRSGGRVFFLRMSDIDWVEAEGNYVRVHAGGVSQLLRETMKHFESTLDRARFVRVQRSTIVNADKIKVLEPAENGEWVIVLRDGSRVPAVRDADKRLRQWIGH